ncbi:MAG: hypothetical protein Q9170_001293 [Blastenia crenularia]
MAKKDILTSKPLDEDDMVYVSDKEDGGYSKKTVPESKPGMILGVKNLYPGERDDRGRFTTTDKIPEDLPEPEENEESGRYALLVRNNKCYDGRKSLSIASIVIQSPLLKKVLCQVLKDYPSMAPELDRLEVVSPFRPFVHRWQRLTDALNNERDPETKSHIQIFYDALKKELEMTLEARDDFLAHGTVTFNSLWMLFEPGDVVFTKLNKRPVAAKLKTAGIIQGRHEDFYRLECEMIYGNGEMFGWGNPKFDIPEFDGMSKITDLFVFPLKYHHRFGRIRKQLIENGKSYERLMGFHHMDYKGIALDNHQPFYVDSRVVLDPNAYKCYKPGNELVLKPLGKTNAAPFGSPETDEESEDSDYLSDEDGLLWPRKKASPALTEDQLMLCGSSVKGYSLRNKRWLDFFVDTVRGIHWKENAWENVVLPSNSKDLIYSLTSCHRERHDGPSDDGLNILLSGPTGVGKTFTVESIAEALHAPLFYVTPADVDLDPKNPDLESPFTDVLEMCGKWNTILVFDQAQGGLDDDQLNDEGRDYSQLLTALESHSAIFFVTCNQHAEDCMDERLQSRFHIYIQLPDLTLATREQIWQKTLESQSFFSFFANPKILAEWDLNGREIANAVTTATKLAPKWVIEMKHLERVVPVGKKPLPFIEDDLWDFASKKDKKNKSKKPIVDVEEKPTPDVIDIVEEPPKRDNIDLDNWTFGTKKEKKGKGKAPVEPTVTEPSEVPPAPVEDEDGWGSFASKKKEKKAKKVCLDPMPPPPPPPPEDVVPEKAEPAIVWDWGSVAKKEKKSKKTVVKDTEIPSPLKVDESGESVPPPPGVDDWDFWASSKKSKKGKKKVVSDDIVPVDAPMNVEAGSNGPPPPLSCLGCRTCTEYQPVVEGHYCKRCGTDEGNFKVVCESCAVAKGYNQFALTNVPCEVCGEVNP